MQNHAWMAGVLEDLLTYSEQNHLAVMVDALAAAAAVAENLTQKAPAASAMMQIAEARV